ncbi:MAG: peptidoglycan recognition family protein [Planctomycetota bacterium]
MNQSDHPGNGSPDPRVFDRRAALKIGAASGLLAWLAGCASGGSMANAPGPLWPTPPTKPDTYPTRPVPKPASGGTSSQAAIGPVPGVIPRSAWINAGIIQSRVHPMNGIRRITVHHAAIDNSDLLSAADVKRRLVNIRHEHINRRPEPFGDIGYHFMIDPQGRIWEGRSLAYQGAHVADQNEHNLGIMLLGDFTRQTPTPQQIASLDSFVTQQMHRFTVPVNRVFTHRELGKSACPGVNLQRYVDRSRKLGPIRYA